MVQWDVLMIHRRLLDSHSSQLQCSSLGAYAPKTAHRRGVLASQTQYTRTIGLLHASMTRPIALVYWL